MTLTTTYDTMLTLKRSSKQFSVGDLSEIHQSRSEEEGPVMFIGRFG